MVFLEKLKNTNIETKIKKVFFENSFEIKKLEKIKNIKVKKICIENLKTGEKFNQKTKLKRQKK